GEFLQGECGFKRRNSAAYFDGRGDHDGHAHADCLLCRTKVLCARDCHVGAEGLTPLRPASFWVARRCVRSPACVRAYRFNSCFDPFLKAILCLGPAFEGLPPLTIST